MTGAGGQAPAVFQLQHEVFRKVSSSQWRAHHAPCIDGAELRLLVTPCPRIKRAQVAQQGTAQPRTLAPSEQVAHTGPQQAAGRPAHAVSQPQAAAMTVLRTWAADCSGGK